MALSIHTPWQKFYIRSNGILFPLRLDALRAADRPRAGGILKNALRRVSNGATRDEEMKPLPFRFHSRPFFRSRMYDFPLTGAQRTHLRGLGQHLEPALKVGKAGLTSEFFLELQRLLNSDELVKLRFLGANRDQRATLCTQIADEGRCVFIGAVGHTALFFRRQPDVSKQRIQFAG